MPSQSIPLLLCVKVAFDYTIEIRWQKTVSVRMETTLTDSDRQNPNCTQTQNKMDGQGNYSCRGDCGRRSLQLLKDIMQHIIDWIFRILGWIFMSATAFGLLILLIVLAGMTYGGYVEFMKYLKLVTS